MSVYDARGRFVARVDGIWRERGTVAEADGAGKYLGELTLDGPSGAAAARLVLAEKIREDRLRGTGLEVVRWGFQDVRRAAPDLVERVEAAWERGDLGRFRGRLVPRQPCGRPDPLRAGCSALTPHAADAARRTPTPEHEVGLTGGIGSGLTGGSRVRGSSRTPGGLSQWKGRVTT